MHFSIPDTQEINEDNGSTFKVSDIFSKKVNIINCCTNVIGLQHPYKRSVSLHRAIQAIAQSP